MLTPPGPPPPPTQQHGPQRIPRHAACGRPAVNLWGDPHSQKALKFYELPAVSRSAPRPARLAQRPIAAHHDPARLAQRPIAAHRDLADAEMHEYLAPTYGAGPSEVELGGGGPAPSAPSGVGMPDRGPQRRVCLAHVVFKAAALLLYIFSGLFFSSEYVFTFVVISLLCAVDLWAVKNVTGRLLVGLRWWNEMDEAGGSVWKFESFEEERFVHPYDSNVFWLTLFATPAIWLLLGIGCLFTLKFQWLLLTTVALGMSGINVIGYIKCKKDARRKLHALGGTVAQEYGGRLLARGMQMWSSSGAAAKG